MASSKQSAASTGQSPPTYQPFAVFCVAYPYTKCSKQYKIMPGDTKATFEWVKHIRTHYREHDEDLPDMLYCWFKRCSYSKDGLGFDRFPDPEEDDTNLDFEEDGPEEDTVDVEEDGPSKDEEPHFNKLINHMWLHFRKGLKGTSAKEHLRNDDIDMLEAVWSKEEVWKARVDGLLSELEFEQFCTMLEQQTSFCGDCRGLEQSHYGKHDWQSEGEEEQYEGASSSA